MGLPLAIYSLHKFPINILNIVIFMPQSFLVTHFMRYASSKLSRPKKKASGVKVV